MNIYEVIFNDKGKGYYFNGGDLKIPNRVTVIVDTEKGLQFGRVIKKVDSYDEGLELKNILRIATKKDYEQYLNNLRDAEEAMGYAKNISKDLDLEMNFVSASFTFDRHQLLLNFYADQRVDFRELVRELAGIYHTRIELRQIGARDKASMVGGVGICGYPLCCAGCLKVHDTITMQMAKNQNLALNPSKINGACGRLLCCLSYEDDEYKRCSYGMPMIGDKVTTSNGDGTVISIDTLNRRYRVVVNNEVEEVKIGDEEIS